MKRFNESIPEPIHRQLFTLLREYFFVGGMPAAVQQWIEHRSLAQVSIIQKDLLASFRDDFTKYSKRMPQDRLEQILTHIPKQLGDKFQYSRVNSDIPSATLKKSLTLLCMARLCHQVKNTDASGLPLAAGAKEKIFKVILLDIGLVSGLLDLALHEQVFENKLRLTNEGGLAEQFIGQTLRTLQPYYVDPSLFYWVREKKTSAAEIDYLIQYKNAIIPIEVKSGSTGRLKSLHLFMALKQSPVAIRFNIDQPSTVQVDMESSLGKRASYSLISLPLYLAGQLIRILQARI